VALSAPSGAGKTTLCAMLLRQFPEFALSISTTTRPPRPNEREGVHYFFVDDREFQRRVDAGEFVEWAVVHERRYGTSKRTVDGLLAEGKHILFDIDVQGAMSLRRIYPERALLIFICPPSEDALRERLSLRKSDSPEVQAVRLANAKRELEWASKFDYAIVNDDLDRAFEELRSILEKECL
jgi:guanylate kinase